MGISIHYNGRIDDKKKIYQLMDELQDIAETMNWPYHCLDEDWAKQSHVRLEQKNGYFHIEGHAGLKGISFTPHPHSETIWLFFDREGRINSPIHLLMQKEYAANGMLHWHSVKTQQAGVETHIAIVKLFKHLKKKYINNLKVTDEGEYWESNNRQRLEEKINGLNDAINMLTSAFSNLPIEADKDAENIVRKIESLLKDFGFEKAPDEDF